MVRWRPPAAASRPALPTSHGVAVADRHFRHAELAERLHQAEAGLEIHRQRVARHGPALGGGQPDALGLHHQVAHGQHQAARYADAVAGAFGAQRAGGEGVAGDIGAQADHAAQGGFQVEAVIGGAGLQVLRGCRGRSWPWLHCLAGAGQERPRSEASIALAFRAGHTGAIGRCGRAGNDSSAAVQKRVPPCRPQATSRRWTACARWRSCWWWPAMPGWTRWCPARSASRCSSSSAAT